MYQPLLSSKPTLCLPPRKCEMPLAGEAQNHMVLVFNASLAKMGSNVEHKYQKND